nr:PocR ligand-binding domain-containing protein [Bacteroidota bacterium]
MNNENMDLKAALKRIGDLESELIQTKKQLEDKQKDIPGFNHLQQVSHSIARPQEIIENIRAEDILGIDAIQSVMGHFNKLTNIGMAILDIKGKILVATGWQDICTKYHRVHPETCKHCLESDTLLANGVEPGTYKIYRCKNNMWDMVTPIMVGNQHIANLFLGQFLFEDEEPDIELFRKQAKLYGFDEEKYLAALKCVPRWSREKVNTVMTIYTEFAQIISQLNYSNFNLLKLNREIRNSEEKVLRNQQQYNLVLDSLPMMFYTVNPSGEMSTTWISE